MRDCFVHMIFQEYVLKRLLTGEKAMAGVGKSQIKLTGIIMTYIIIGIINRAGFTYYQVTADVNERIVAEYLLCQSNGFSETCQLDFIALSNVEVPSIVVYCLMPLLPIVTLLFSVDFKYCGKTQTSPSTGKTHLTAL